ncbi:MAG: cell wall-binding repeat-containing protein [Actinobacteria bacterium]|nr:cell wall-binding repeat-containing protein [Actinomycetota bacterium]
MSHPPSTTRLLVVTLTLVILGGIVLVTTAAAETVEVQAVSNFRFTPATVEVEVADRVVWRNTDSKGHTVTSTSDDGATFDQLLKPGESFTLTFTETGTVDYFCRFDVDKGMVGKVTVTTASGREVDRLAGPGRVETAVEISRYQFPNGAPEVYLADKELNPDALVGGSLTLGPILLVPACGDVPEVVLDEIRRLRPARVVALGGEARVCDETLQQAATA